MKSLQVTLLLFFQAAAVTDEDAEILPIYTGEDVTLPCYSPVNTTVALLEWTRPDLVSPEYVFLYRDEQSYTTFQHPSFVGRVELKDKQMKGGDASLILRNVSSSDSGVYECRVSQGGVKKIDRANIKTEPISVIKLEVKDSGGSKGNPNRGLVGFGVSLALMAVTCVIIVTLILRKRIQD